MKTIARRPRFLPATGGLPAALLLSAASLNAQTGSYNPGVPWGPVQLSTLQEASGLAASQRHDRVLWTHNDGNRRQVHAISPGGAHLATFVFTEPVGDVEDIAVGPGPDRAVSCLYIGDIGGQVAPTDVRASVKIVRFPEPDLPPPGGGAPPQVDVPTVDVFTLTYPDGSYDAESLFVDPRSGDLHVVTKSAPAGRVYRVNLDGLPSRSTAALTFVGLIPLSVPSAASISRDGSRVVIRNETQALLWTRQEGETIAAALARPAVAAPVIGPPLEPNGEAIAFTADGSGYLTLSEGASPMLYHFQARRDAAPVLQAPLPDRSLYTGAILQLHAPVSGFPAPSFVWRRDGAVIPGQTSSVLTLTNVTLGMAGDYEVITTNALGTVTGFAAVTVRPRPLLRVTEVQTAPGSPTGDDWWELTSFETSPLDLSGWRFNDDSGDLTSTFTLPAGLVINPGESLIFVDGRSEAQFRAWWGDAVPPRARVITYSGSGLALGPNGDTIRLWERSAVSVSDTILQTRVGTATTGVTFTYNPESDEFGQLSLLGVNAARRSATGTDTGSPGAWLPPPVAPDLEIVRLAAGLHVRFPAQRLRFYTLESTSDPATGPWLPAGSAFRAAGDGSAALRVPESGATSSFFRVLVR